MRINNFFLFLISLLILQSCADIKTIKNVPEKKYYSSFGFTLVYEEDLFTEKVVSKKINNEDIIVMHSFLKTNTPIKIINPVNQKSIDTKVFKKAEYPKIFNSVISKKISSILDLDESNPYVEILEIKKNKKFVAKKSNTYDEERNVAEKAPVNEITMDTLNETQVKKKKSKKQKDKKFIIIISDFYYEDSALNLKNELLKNINSNYILVKKISNTKYRLFAGPFKNFNALKTTYISLNNLGFENLNIYTE